MKNGILVVVTFFILAVALTRVMGMGGGCCSTHPAHDHSQMQKAN